MKLIGLALLLFSVTALGQVIPENAKKYAPILKQEAIKKWPTLKTRQALAGQAEQESCISLTSKGCWNPRTQFKTEREWGRGILQSTIVYNKDGSIKFDNADDIRKLDKDLSSWKGEGIWDPALQMRALVVYDRSIYMKLPLTIIEEKERLAMTFAAYNGGLGGLLQDRRMCQGTPSCNPNYWWGNVEKTSMKQKTKMQGYGKSFFEINREYPKNILLIRMKKYESLMRD